ncbi:ATP-grasp domain-containing protein [Nocardia crassostreae]|uniref:ATP-grasp domain-containing protein n=1 Tax=Nocardia crassostreae TaxID=53428 RepID=UPI000830E71E|nr:ATP-grasp domain-containing protein [Nocardia crassostreae]
MIRSLGDALDAFGSVGWLGFTPRPFLLLPLLRTGCLSVLISGQRADSGWADRFGIECVSAEDLTRTRDEAGGRSGLRHLLPHAGELLSRWRGRRLALASYGQWWPEWRAALAGSGVDVHPPPTGTLPELLVDKTRMRPWLRSIGVQTPADTVTARLDHRLLHRRFGCPYVVQQPRGTGGHGTFLVRDEQGLDGIPSGGPWLASQFIPGVPINYHGLATGSGISVAPGSVQLTDLAEGGAPFGTYSGCDFGALHELPAATQQQARRAVQRIGDALAALGYRGIFGVDLVVAGGTVVVLELNCRMQSSTWLLGELELGAGVLPTKLRHILEQHGYDTAGELLPKAPGAVQVTLRYDGPAARLTEVPRSGRYALIDSGLVWRGEGYGLLECGTDEIVLVHLPRPATVLAPGAALARLISHQPLTTPDGRAFTTRGRQTASATRSLFGLSEQQHRQ